MEERQHGGHGEKAEDTATKSSHLATPAPGVEQRDGRRYGGAEVETPVCPPGGVVTIEGIIVQRRAAA